MKSNLLFSSVGNITEFYKLWCDHHRNYDIFLVFYDEINDITSNKYKTYADYYRERKGSKFQNFYFYWNNEPEILQNYENYFICDDDIIINTSDINKLFDIRNKYSSIDILQPSFCPYNSRISHSITVQNPNNFLRFVNFVEVNAMLFKKDALIKCMEIYDPILVGYGIDYLFLWYLGNNKTDNYAIVDSIGCINPDKGNNREIDRLQPKIERQKIWNEIADKYKIKIWDHSTFKRIRDENIVDKILKRRIHR